MRIAQITKNKADKVFIVVRNIELVAPQVGDLVSYPMNGTEDGLQVQLTNSNASPSVAGVLLAGVMMDNPDSYEVGLAQVYGFCTRTRLLLRTRAASTDNWGSAPAQAIGDVLIMVTDSDPSVEGFGTTAVGPNLPYAVLCEALASLDTLVATGVSITGSDTATDTISYNTSSNVVSTTGVKSFLRML